MSEISQSIESPATSLPKSQGITSSVARGSLWSLGGQSIVLLISLITTPFTVRLLGPENYGVLALINALMSYLAFSEFGMGTASTRFGSEAYARDDHEGEAAVIWTSLWIGAIPAMLASLGCALAARPIVEYALKLPVHLQQISVVGLRIAALGFFARTIAGILNTPQMVRLRMDLVAKINSAGSIIQGILVIAVLLFGGGLIGTVAVISGVSILIAILFWWVSLRLLPCLKRPRVSGVLLGPLMHFGGAVVVSSLAALILSNGERVLLARYGSVRALAHYSVALALATTLTQVPSAMTQSMLPALSRLQAGTDREPLQKLTKRALNGTLFWVIPAAVLMCAAAKPFFTLWAGPEFGRESTLPFYVLAVGLVFNVLAWVPYNLLVSLGKTGLIARFHVIEVIPYILLTILLTSWFGALGAALAWSLRVIIATPLLILFAQRASGVTLSPAPRNPRILLAALAILMLPPVSAMIIWRLPAISIAVAVASAAAYASLVWRKVLTGEERAGMVGLLPWRRIPR